jgi:hypothetical protein
MFKVHKNKEFYIYPEIFDFIQAWTTEEKAKAAKDLYMEVKKYLRSSAFYSVEDLIQEAMLSVFKYFCKNNMMKPTYIPLIARQALSNFMKSKKLKQIDSSDFYLYEMSEIYGVKKIAEEADILEEIEIFDIVKKELEDLEFEVFYDIYIVESKRNDTMKKYNISYSKYYDIKKKVMQIFKP